jgi:phosphotriesterase-related protein
MTLAAVATVRGPVAVGQLGTTLMHEHVFVLTPDVMNNYGDAWWDEEERVADAVGKLTALKAAGVGRWRHDRVRPVRA